MREFDPRLPYQPTPPAPRERTNMAKLDVNDIFGALKSSSIDPGVFEKIDERDFEKAPNFISWVTSPKFLNTSVLPRQVEIATKLMTEWCPRCSKPGYINTLFDQSLGNIRDNIIFLEHGVCPKCKVTRYELVTKGESRLYTELVNRAGQRGGKSKLVGLLSTYVLHRILKITNPLRYYGQPSGEILQATFSALNDESCKENLWEPTRGFIDSSPWF